MLNRDFVLYTKKEMNWVLFIYMAVSTDLYQYWVREVRFTFRVTKRHPVNVSYINNNNDNDNDNNNNNTMY